MSFLFYGISNFCAHSPDSQHKKKTELSSFCPGYPVYACESLAFSTVLLRGCPLCKFEASAVLLLTNQLGVSRWAGLIIRAETCHKQEQQSVLHGRRRTRRTLSLIFWHHATWVLLDKIEASEYSKLSGWILIDVEERVSRCMASYDYTYATSREYEFSLLLHTATYSNTRIAIFDTQVRY